MGQRIDIEMDTRWGTRMMRREEEEPRHMGEVDGDSCTLIKDGGEAHELDELLRE